MTRLSYKIRTEGRVATYEECLEEAARNRRTAADFRALGDEVRAERNDARASHRAARAAECAVKA